MVIGTDRNVIAAAIAAKFAGELGLKPGNLWEPPIVRQIASDLRNQTAEFVEQQWRFRLGL